MNRRLECELNLLKQKASIKVYLTLMVHCVLQVAIHHS